MSGFRTWRRHVVNTETSNGIRGLCCKSEGITVYTRDARKNTDEGVFIDITKVATH